MRYEIFMSRKTNEMGTEHNVLTMIFDGEKELLTCMANAVDAYKRHYGDEPAVVHSDERPR